MSKVEQKGIPGGGGTGARRGRGVEAGLTREREVKVELTDAEPTLQQRQAYDRFWRLLMERMYRERLPDNNELKA